MRIFVKTVLLTWLGVVTSVAAYADGGEETGGECARGIWIADYFRIDGAIKTRLEVDMNEAGYRFSVKNTRFGVSGNLSDQFSYRIQLELDNEGALMLLDSYVRYNVGRWDLRLGQQGNGFSVDMIRPAWLNPFVNRSMLAKYLSGYVGNKLSGGRVVPTFKSVGSRDLGFRAVYSIPSAIPVRIGGGFFNGSGIGTPTWGRKLTVVGRVDIGEPEGLHGALSYYDGYTPQHAVVTDHDGTLEEQTDAVEKMRMVGAELRYVHNGFTVEGEYARRYLGEGSSCRLLTAAFLQSYYRIPVARQQRAIHFVMPVARWDFGNGIDYINTTQEQLQRLNIDRLSVGVTLGFAAQFIRPELRFAYERYFMKQHPSDYSINRLFHDRATMEVVIAF